MVARVDVEMRLWVALSRLERRLRREPPNGVTPLQFSALSTLEEYGPLRLNELAHCEALSPSTISRALAALAAADYVTRDPDPADGRAVFIGPSERGRRELLAARHGHTAALAARLHRITDLQSTAVAAAPPALESLGAPPRRKLNVNGPVEMPRRTPQARPGRTEL